MTRRRPLLLSLGFLLGLVAGLVTCSRGCESSALSSFVLSARRVLGIGAPR